MIGKTIKQSLLVMCYLILRQVIRFGVRFGVAQCEQTFRICAMLCNELNMPFIDLSHLSENS